MKRSEQRRVLVVTLSNCIRVSATLLVFVCVCENYGAPGH